MAIALSRLPNKLWTVPRDTPAASATAVKENRRGPSWRSVSDAAVNNVFGTVRFSRAASTDT
ncbi:hypothetical protein MSTO_38510 [Mycobacterium stomatepiae]|uniref:Uncharacterized protein n=1 Tax=Mycobacterium stomatepiae TaxID=470076 RepID=A0A7I7QC78_9MYCO|nr:hypothetical protein MSTO_38510 [Mycobacterium stomatepiae]